MTSIPHDMVTINSEFTLLGPSKVWTPCTVYQCNVHAQLAGSMQAIIYMPCIWDKVSDYAHQCNKVIK